MVYEEEIPICGGPVFIYKKVVMGKKRRKENIKKGCS